MSVLFIYVLYHAIIVFSPSLGLHISLPTNLSLIEDRSMCFA